jgi:hypothetical protein
MSNTDTTTGGATMARELITYVIPCSARKAAAPAPARDLYTGPMFTHTLAAAEALARWDREQGHETRILVLSARHGLVPLDAELAPYDCKLGDPGTVSAARLAGQAWKLGIRAGGGPWARSPQVYALCPAAYYGLLSDALQRLDVYPQDCYEATQGIGEQRHVNTIAASWDTPADAA